MRPERMLNKEKVTVTLSPGVIRGVGRLCRELKIRSRSAAIERLLEQSIADDERRRLERETEAYYLSLSGEEKDEDKAWARSSSDQAIRRFDKD